MKAIILAAGMGKRLQDVAEGMPKSMIKIEKKSIIHNQIESCRQVGINNFVIVVGYKAKQLKEHILEVCSPEEVTFVLNKVYETTNTLYSLYLCKEYLTDDFIYFNADVMFKSELLKLIAESSTNSQLLLETKSCAEEEVKMIIDENNRIEEIGKDIPISQCAGEFIGIAKFKKEVIPEFQKALEQGIAMNQENNYFEFAVNILAKNVFLEAVPTQNIPCLEIDFPEDLQMARKIFDG
ncbi:MAG: phosphocholine cytidylyltransferase family protein [Candidatus Cloacimonadota bacterium]|nr:phosphocholine cytidylyltransferase family protein [Candidatus Cloacimonadota bacterium]